MKGNRKKGRQRASRASKQLEQVNLYAAGIDVGSAEHYVAVPADLSEEPVRSFSGFTGDLHRLADWLVELGIETVAMESTGVYWIPLFELLEARGFKVVLANARAVKNVPGRKSDVLDCQWLQQLHTYGLLSGAFRPPAQVCALRAYMRQREMLVQSAARHAQHMQKALRQMNLLLDNVVSDILGKTGLKIIRAIVAGERDADKLARYRHGGCKRSRKEIAESLHGHYCAEHLFSLRQALELYDFYQLKIADCDTALAQQLNEFDAPHELDAPLSNAPTRRKNELHFNAREQLIGITGVDLTRIDGLDQSTVLKVLSETGVDVSPWPTVKHFGSWLRLSPGSKVSGGKVLSSKTLPSANRAAAALRMAAQTQANSKSALGAFYRRVKSRRGAPKAVTATAYKLARIIYSMLKNGNDYVDQGQDYYEQQYRDRSIRNLKRNATRLGFSLIPQDEQHAVLSTG